MKAVIVECSNGAAVALCDDGTFRRFKNRNYSIGQELLIKQRIPSNRMVQKLSICASLALVLLSFVGIGSFSYVEPYSYVSLDINPSIEYALNRYDKVISVSGINAEGQQVVSSIEADIKNQNITTALGVTIGQLEKDHYIIQEGYNHVIVSVYSNNDTKAQSITSRVNSLSAEKSDICSIDAIPVSKEVKDDADSLGITPGKLALIHAVAETSSDSDFNVSEWTDKTVSELETTIQQANSQITDSGAVPASGNVINSEYLSSVLDDNAANTSDNTSTASAVEADKEAGSASTDHKTTITDDTADGLGTSEGVSAAKPDNSSDSSLPAANGNSGSSDKSDNSDTAGNGSTVSATDNGSAANQTTSSNNTDKNGASDKDSFDHTSDKSGTSTSKDSGSADKTNSSSDKHDVSSGSSSRKDTDEPDTSDKDSKTDNSLKEDSGSKKDSYPSSDNNRLEDNAKENSSGDTAQKDDSGHPNGASDNGISDDLMSGNESSAKGSSDNGNFEH